MLVLVVSSSCVSFARAIDDNTPGFGSRSSAGRTSQKHVRKTRDRSVNKASYDGDGRLRVGNGADSIAATRRTSNIDGINLAAAGETENDAREEKEDPPLVVSSLVAREEFEGSTTGRLTVGGIPSSEAAADLRRKPDGVGDADSLGMSATAVAASDGGEIAGKGREGKTTVGSSSAVVALLSNTFEGGRRSRRDLLSSESFMTQSSGFCSEAITDASTCSTAASDLGYAYQGGNNYGTSYPEGCFGYSSVYVYFNTASGGSCGVDANSECICVEPAPTYIPTPAPTFTSTIAPTATPTTSPAPSMTSAPTVNALNDYEALSALYASIGDTMGNSFWG